MTNSEYFFWLAGQVGGALAGLWYITVPAAAIGSVGLVGIIRAGKGVGMAVASALMGILAPALILLVGTLLRAPNSGQGGQGYSVLGASVVCLAVFVAWTVGARGCRLAVSGVLVAAVWPLLLATFVGVMSVSGDWL